MNTKSNGNNTSTNGNKNVNSLKSNDNHGQNSGSTTASIISSDDNNNTVGDNKKHQKICIAFCALIFKTNSIDIH